MERPGRAGPALSGLFHEFSYPGSFLECPAGTAQPLRPEQSQPDLDSYRVSCNCVGHAVFDRIRGELYPSARRLVGFLAESSAVGTDALRKLAVRGRARPPAR